ncbi:CBS domain-containing protein [Candidatus Nitrosotalea bavarica]|uniref:CBS domain-containing protein n=1 Tax=Candidatus Nitrosotalea bavarica TaxID=1903277 RepID=UPI001055B854|nr:CBS domain-containing protein [Candidatus Nitrosotalea bavarica]
MDTFVKDMMKKQIVSIDVTLTVKEAAKMMEDTGVSCLVVTKENVPVGIITERDFVTKITSLDKSSSTLVQNVMSVPLITSSPSDTAKKLAELMKEKKIHKVPVMEGTRLVGIVTATDLIKKCIIDSDLELRQICNSFAQMAF